MTEIFEEVDNRLTAGHNMKINEDKAKVLLWNTGTNDAAW